MVAITSAILLIAYWNWQYFEDFAYAGDRTKSRRSPAPYGRIGGKPIIPNPEAEKFPAGVPRDEDGFPVITLREQYETNVTMYKEGLGPFPGPPMDFSGDWDYIAVDPDDEGFDPDAPMPTSPMVPPKELLSLQPEEAIIWPERTTDEPIPEGKPKAKRKVAAPPEPEPAAKPLAARPAAKDVVKPAAAKPAASKKAAAKPVAAKSVAEPVQVEDIDEEAEQDYALMTVKELKAELEARGLATTGKKADLIERLTKGT